MEINKKTMEKEIVKQNIYKKNYNKCIDLD